MKKKIIIAVFSLLLFSMYAEVDINGYIDKFLIKGSYIYVENAAKKTKYYFPKQSISRFFFEGSKIGFLYQDSGGDYEKELIDPNKDEIVLDGNNNLIIKKK